MFMLLIHSVIADRLCAAFLRVESAGSSWSWPDIEAPADDERRSKAFCTSTNDSLLLLLLLLDPAWACWARSGWHLRAALRKALLTSSSDAAGPPSESAATISSSVMPSTLSASSLSAEQNLRRKSASAAWPWQLAMSLAYLPWK